MYALIFVNKKLWDTHWNKLSKDIQQSFKNALYVLQNDPYTHTLDIKQLVQWKPKTYRLRIGDYRLLYHIIKPATIAILKIIHRRDAYIS